MPLIDLRCTAASCQHTFEYQRPLAEYPHTPPCEQCQSATEQWHPAPRVRGNPDPVVVYRAPDGTFRFPGDPTSASTHRYDRQGFERIELRSAADVRRFETQMNKREYSRAARRVERMQEMREEREKHSRRDLRSAMEQMSERGRAVARAMIRHNDNKPRERASDPGFHVDVYSNYRGNRDESRDAQGRRRRD